MNSPIESFPVIKEFFAPKTPFSVGDRITIIEGLGSDGVFYNLYPGVTPGLKVEPEFFNNPSISTVKVTYHQGDGSGTLVTYLNVKVCSKDIPADIVSITAPDISFYVNAPIPYLLGTSSNGVTYELYPNFTNNFSVEPLVPTRVGDCSLHATFKNYEEDLTITAVASVPTTVELFTGTTTKEIYLSGTFAGEGAELKIIYDSGDIKIVGNDQFTVDPTTFTTLGPKIVTYTYTEGEHSFSVSESIVVVEDPIDPTDKEYIERALRAMREMLIEAGKISEEVADNLEDSKDILGETQSLYDYLLKYTYKSFTKRIGDGVNSSYIVDHNLDTMDLLIQCWDVVSGEVIPCQAIRIDKDSVQLDFDEVIAVDGVDVVISAIDRALMEEVPIDNVTHVGYMTSDEAIILLNS